MTTRRRVAVITGTRAEYGLLRSTIAAIDDHPRLELQLVATGMHLLRKFGRTVRRIEEDGWTVDARVPMQRGDDDPLDQARGLSRGVSGIAAFLEKAKTDVVLVLGDRIEAMAGALAATTTGRFVAHLHGGDVAAGDMDDALRHSVTKLAHIHFAASRDAARRIVRMGERADRVHVVGAPGLDDLYVLSGAAPKRRKRRGALIVQHACGRSSATERRVMSAIVNAVGAHGLEATVVYPNSDRGHSGVVAAIERAAGGGGGGVRAVRSLRRTDYLNALLRTRVLVGNSSSGIIEAAAAGTPCVNVGRRQDGRLRVGSSVIESGETFSDVREAVSRALARRPRRPRATPYGDGRSGVRVAKILSSVRLGAFDRRKRNTF